MRATCFVAAVLAFSVFVPRSAADVITVSHSPAHGADFDNIQAAISAAGNGDVILVSNGYYPGFSVSGFADPDMNLHIVADGSAVTVYGSVTINGTLPTQRVSLVGLSLISQLVTQHPEQFGSEPTPLTIESCAGPVRVERVTVRAASWPVGGGLCGDTFYTEWPKAPDAVRVDFSSDVMFQTCVLEGGVGIDAGDDYDPLGDCVDHGSDGGYGLVVSNATVHLHNVIARGGAGADHGFGGAGGRGVFVEGTSKLLASGLVATGGEFGFSHDWPISGWNHGGTGLVAGPFSVVTNLGSLYSGGNGVPDGVPLTVSGELLNLPGSAHRLITAGPAREGETLTLSLTAAQGDLVWVWAGLETAFIDKPGFGGAFYVAAPFAFGPKFLPPLSAGVNLWHLAIPELGPSVDVVAADIQAFVLEADGDRVLTASTLGVLLDAGF